MGTSSTDAEPDAIAHMTDVELETFARTVVAERDALAAALESTRAEVYRLGTSALEVLIDKQNAEAERDAARAELAAERAKVQAVEAIRQACIGHARAALAAGSADELSAWHAVAEQLTAALTAAQPRSELPPRDPKNPGWCQLDHGCSAEYGHDGPCDMTGPIMNNDADDCGKCARCLAAAQPTGKTP